jgi:hypothetical protein
MTYFDKITAESIPTLDIALVWGVLGLRAANTSSFNSEIKAVTLNDSVNWVETAKWDVTLNTDESVSLALSVDLYLLDNYPLKNKVKHLLERVVAPSDYQTQVWDFDADIPPAALGYQMPAIPDWIISLEQFVAWVATILDRINKFIKDWNTYVREFALLGQNVAAACRALILLVKQGLVPDFFLPLFVQNPDGTITPAPNPGGLNDAYPTNANNDEGRLRGLFDNLAAIEPQGIDRARTLGAGTVDAPSQVNEHPTEVIPTISECAEATPDNFGQQLYQVIFKTKYDK